jgi:hypothetical protein
MPQATKNNIYYIHTTHTIIDYITTLSRRYLGDTQIVHLLDESMLADIKRDDTESARSKLLHMVEGALHSGAEQIMVTCTSTGRLIDALPATYKPYIQRIESAAVQTLITSGQRTGIVYTNPAVWPEFQQIMRDNRVPETLYTPAYIKQAFDKILSGDREGHDRLIKEFLTKSKPDVASHLLAQVSICSALERLEPFAAGANTISMAELGIMQLRETKKL